MQVKGHFLHEKGAGSGKLLCLEMEAVGAGPPPDLEFGLAVIQHGLQHGHRLIRFGNLLPIDGKEQVPLAQAKGSKERFRGKIPEPHPSLLAEAFSRPHIDEILQLLGIGKCLREDFAVNQVVPIPGAAFLGWIVPWLYCRRHGRRVT